MALGKCIVVAILVSLSIFTGNTYADNETKGVALWGKLAPIGSPQSFVPIAQLKKESTLFGNEGLVRFLTVSATTTAEHFFGETVIQQLKEDGWEENDTNMSGVLQEIRITFGRKSKESDKEVMAAAVICSINNKADAVSIERITVDAVVKKVNTICNDIIVGTVKENLPK